MLIEQWDMVLPEASELLDDAGYYLKESAQYEQAEQLLQCALAIRERVLGADDPLIANSRNNLGTLYYYQGKYKEAEPLYQHALAICERVLGPNHPDTVGTRENYTSLKVRMNKENT